MKKDGRNEQKMVYKTMLNLRTYVTYARGVLREEKDHNE